MSEDFIIEETDSEEGSSNRPFLIIVGVLLLLLVIGIICTASFAFLGQDGDEVAAITQTVIAIEATNAEIERQNAFVTQTLAARATEDARPTNTPTNTPIPPSPTPTNTATPTETPVVGDGDGQGDVTPTATVSLLTTPAFSGSGGATATPVAGSGQLPQTGLELSGILIAAAAFIGLLFVARRLRAG